MSTDQSPALSPVLSEAPIELRNQTYEDLTELMQQLGEKRYRGFAAAERKKRIEESLSRVGLSSRLKHYPSELSGGQQQRVAIARALAGSPRLLMADEPTGNLDSLMARGVMELLEEVNRQGTTIVMVTHDAELAARAQRNVHVIDGQVTDFDDEPRLRREAEIGDRRSGEVVA